MATRVVILVFIPTVAALFGLFWFRRKKRPPFNSDESNPEIDRSLDSSTVSSQINISNSFENKPHAELANDAVKIQPGDVSVAGKTDEVSPQNHDSNSSCRKRQPIEEQQSLLNGSESESTNGVVRESVVTPAKGLNNSSMCHQMEAPSCDVTDLDNESASQPGSPNVEAEVSEVTDRAVANGIAVSSASTTPSVDSPIEKSSLSGSNGFSSDAHSEVSGLNLHVVPSSKATNLCSSLATN